MSSDQQQDAASAESATCDMGFDAAWERFCEVVRELDMTSAELEALRSRSA